MTAPSLPDIVERLRAKQRRCKGSRQQSTWFLCADAIAEIERLRAERNAVVEGSSLAHLKAMSDRMAEDEGLWFIAETCAEAYVQQELRKLCGTIEALATAPAQ